MKKRLDIIKKNSYIYFNRKKIYFKRKLGFNYIRSFMKNDFKIKNNNGNSRTEIPGVLNVEDIMEISGKNYHDVLALFDWGLLPPTKVGTAYITTEQEFKNFLKRNGISLSPKENYKKIEMVT